MYNSLNDLLLFNVVHYSSLFQCYYALVDFLVYLYDIAIQLEYHNIPIYLWYKLHINSYMLYLNNILLHKFHLITS